MHTWMFWQGQSVNVDNYFYISYILTYIFRNSPVIQGCDNYLTSQFFGYITSLKQMIQNKSGPDCSNQNLERQADIFFYFKKWLGNPVDN